MDLIKGATYKVVNKRFKELFGHSGLDSIIIEMELEETNSIIVKLLFAITHLAVGGVLYVNLEKSNFPTFASLCQRLLRCQAELIKNNEKRYLKIVRNRYEG